MSDFEYQRTLIIGVIIGASVCILGFSMMRTTQPVKPVESKSNFEVVDTYKGCDVVQWHYSMLAEYKYFLDCDNK